MKKWMLVIATIAAVAVMASAQKPSDVYKGLKYDKTTEVKIHGAVDEVQEFDCPIGGSMGSHALINSTDGPMVVHLAPVKFMKDYGLEITKGDKVEIIGSKVKDSTGRDTILARELVKDNVTLRFRDNNGKPIW